jgi:hypothetical protein
VDPIAKPAATKPKKKSRKRKAGGRGAAGYGPAVAHAPAIAPRLGHHRPRSQHSGAASLSAGAPSALAQIGEAFSDYLRGTAVSFSSSSEAPMFDAVEAALEAYASAMAGLRRDGAT